jgi:ATP-dependent DNA helicase RecQ
VAVVTVASRRRPRLVADLGRRIATVGRLPLLGEVVVDADGAAARGNSAQRVRALHGRVAVGPPLAAAVAEVGGPVLLVDDLVDSGWTMALAVRELRRAGAPAVLPFALALAG